MSNLPFKSPVEDSVPMVDREVAVGEDLDFQRKWWMFERITWIFFTLILILTLSGVFGRGYFAKGERRSSDAAFYIKYDKIERTGTPSDLTIIFDSKAIRDGKIRLYVSESLISKLGAQRISPQPQETQVGNGGLTYSFSALGPPATVIFSLQPSGPGLFPFELRLPESNALISAKVAVVP
jgi:hypothetical protein